MFRDGLNLLGIWDLATNLPNSLRMLKDLPEQNADRFAPLGAVSNTSRLALHTADEHGERSKPAQPPDIERDYLATCQKLEQLVERKRRAEEETVDVASLHQELCLIGSRIQREPDDPCHAEDYLAVLRRVKESLWRKIEAEDLKGEFQKLHFDLLGLGHKLGFERPQPAPAPNVPFAPPSIDDMNLGDVERQIAELQAQIRSLHDHR